MVESGTSVCGRKFDSEKPRWDLLPVEPVEDIVKVLTYGSKKYADDNWKCVKPFKKRYFSAMLRHIFAWWCGESTDKETGLSHLSHAGCCLLFLAWGEKQKPEIE